ncbi:MAG: hypothetical protein P8L30_07975 [Longimicrobiales bacterium]|jgi:hypothetical protein|nr:hypothetical protein [Gemmatimonadales bacterium]MBT6696404.1 hypothetical protein [Gemmatimonadales bacterium]MDG2240126.1 hypothetical protein [Longimicrobiales bacterium]NCG31678.1 hypothetical protein [Pseudomonadota bacterium]
MPRWCVLTLSALAAALATGPASAQEIFPERLDGEVYSERVGERASVFFSRQDSLVAIAVLSFLDEQIPLPGLPDSVPGGVRAYLAHTPAAFDELTGGTVPEWRAGVAIPSLGVVVVPTGEGMSILDVDGRRTLRHEWAHLGLSDAIGGMRSPRWFTEGYAQWASVGFDASEAWKLRVLMAMGRTPPMDSLTLRWPTNRAQAEIAYLLSASAVTYLLEGSGERGLEIFVERWRTDRSFESAFRKTFGVTTARFEEDWSKHVKSRYGWLFVLSHSAVFWGLMALVLLFIVSIRRGRGREHMARLRAGEPPDRPAYWMGVEDEGGPEDPPHGVYEKP